MSRSSVVTRRTRFEHAARVAAARAAARQEGRAAGGGEPASSSAHAAAFWSRVKRVAVPAGGAAEGGTGDDRCENARRVLVADRTRRRRWPWIPGAVGAGSGLVGYWAGAAAVTIGAAADPAVLAAPTAAIPAAAAVLAAARYRPAIGRWWPELAAGGAGASVLAYGLATTGPTPLLAAAAVLGTTVLGARWWAAHPLGPQVPPLTPPELPPAAPPNPEHDRYCLAWAQTNGSKNGKVPGSRLTNRGDGAYTTTFDVVLARGVHTIDDLLTHRVRLAGGLGEDAARVLFAPAAAGESAARARLTIIHTDPVAETRYFTGPQVTDGLIRSVGRSVDGTGDIDVLMWNDSGTVPTMIVGSTGGGKSGATNILVASALSTGVLNLLYADPKGNSSTALATRARIAVIGKQNVLALPRLIQAILDARAQIAAELHSDLIFPSRDVPGWMFLHDEYSFVAHDPKTAQLWTETVNTVRALGVWTVGCNQSQGQAAWGGDHARSAFASQVIAFRTNSKSSADLVPGLLFDPSELPLDDGRPRRPVPGMAVHAHLDAPVRWDWLPSDADAARMVSKGLPAPELTASAAFDHYFTAPPLHPLDEAAIVSVLGPAVNGRWQIGGTRATHHLDDNTGHGTGGHLTPSDPPVQAPWGTRTAAADAEVVLSPVQAQVLALIHGGTTATADLVAAATASKAAVHDALDTLIAHGRITRISRGHYQPTTTASVAVL